METPLIKQSLDNVLQNTFNRMSDDSNFTENCDSLVRLVHESIKEKWNLFVEADIDSFCKELQSFIEKSIYAKNIIAIYKERMAAKAKAAKAAKAAVASEASVASEAAVVTQEVKEKEKKAPWSDNNRIYQVNVTSHKVDHGNVIIMYAARYTQSITDTEWASVRGSGGWFIVDRDLKILTDEPMYIYPKIGQDFNDAVNSIEIHSDSVAIDEQKVLNTLRTLSRRNLVVKADGSHMRIHMIDGKYLLISTQMLEYYSIIAILPNIDETVNAIMDAYSKTQTKMALGTPIKGLKLCLYFYLHNWKNEVLFKDNTFQLEFMSPEHPGFSEEIGYCVTPHSQQVVAAMPDFVTSIPALQEELTFIIANKPSNENLQKLITDVENHHLCKYLEIEGPLLQSTYEQFTKDIILILLVTLSNIDGRIKKRLLLGLQNEQIKKIIGNLDKISALNGKLIVILDILLYYLGQGDVPEGLLLGLELKVKVQLWKLAHGAVGSISALFKDTAADIGKSNIPSMKLCALHTRTLLAEYDKFLPPGNNVREKINKSVRSLGPFGLVILEFMKDEPMKPMEPKNSITIFNELVERNEFTSQAIEKIRDSDILFDYDGTVDTKEKIWLIQQLAQCGIIVKILTANNDLKIRANVLGYSGHPFPVEIEIISIADHYPELLTSAYHPPAAAVIKALLTPTNPSIKLFDDSELVQKMFKHVRSDQCIDANKLNYGLFAVKVAIAVLEKLRNNPRPEPNKSKKILGVMKFLHTVTMEWYGWDMSRQLDVETLISDPLLQPYFTQLTENREDGKISYVVVSGHPGSGKSTLINAYLQKMRSPNPNPSPNICVYAKDIVHMEKINEQHSYNFKGINARTSNDLALLIKSILDINIAHSNANLVILDGATFDGFGSIPSIKHLKLESRVYSRDDFINMICKSERRSVLNMCQNIKIEEYGGITLVDYARSLQDPNKYKDLLIALVENKHENSPIELVWSALNIDMGAILQAIETINPPILEPLKGKVISSITKKGELHAYTQFRNDSGRPVILIALFLLGIFEDSKLIVTELVELTKNDVRGALYLKVKLEPNAKFNFYEQLFNESHCTIDVLFFGGAGLLHKIKDNKSIVTKSYQFAEPVALEPQLVFMFKGDKIKINTIIGSVQAKGSVHAKGPSGSEKGPSGLPKGRPSDRPSDEVIAKSKEEKKAATTATAATATVAEGGGSLFKLKYLKYKSKYLELKKSLEFSLA